MRLFNFKYRPLFFALLLGVIMPINSFTQESIDSLNKVLKKQKGKERIETLLAISGEYTSARDFGNAIQVTVLVRNEAIKLKLNEQITLAYLRFGSINLDKGDFQKAITYFDSAFTIAKKNDYNKQIASSLNYKSVAYLYLQRYDSAKIFSQQTLDFAIEHQIIEFIANGYKQLGLSYYFLGEYGETLRNWEKELEERRKTTDKREISMTLNNLGIIYKARGIYDKAIDYYKENLKIVEELKDSIGMARTYSNIGNVYYLSGIDYEKALENYMLSLRIFISKADTQFIVTSYNNIGLIYAKQKKYDMALKSYENVLRLAKDKSNIALAKKNLGELFNNTKKYKKAIASVEEALVIFTELGNKLEIASCESYLGAAYLGLKIYDQAELHYLKSIELNREMDLTVELTTVYKDISSLYDSINNFRLAYDYLLQYTTLKDSTFTEKYTDLIRGFENEQKNKELEVQRERIKRQQEEAKRQKLALYAVLFILLTIIVFAFLIAKQYNEKRKANIKLEEQNIEISNQRDQILHQKQEITDSITYASRIQRAILPPDEVINEILHEHFILWKPRDIVSGDFFWLTKKGNYRLFTAADCTGHGVPGAFMSMLGTAFLNEIVGKMEVIDAGEILNQLRFNVVSSLHQTGKVGESQDGMDIALCVIDDSKHQLQYAGANNPMYLIRNGEVIEYKADKMPIGIYKDKKSDFIRHDIDLLKDDCVYVFSDGFPDQFGGPDQRKFMKKNFRDLLLRIHMHPMEEQRKLLDKTILDWIGDYHQIDDILVIGIRY